jgi:hypothetical protein
MNLWLLTLKAIVVIFFLVMFLRGSKLTWGIGLVTVTSAILLDALLGTFDRDLIVDQLGFFYQVIGGILFSGAAIWFWGILRPRLAGDQLQPVAANSPAPDRRPAAQEWTVWSKAEPVAGGAVYDRQMMFEQIRFRFAPGEIRDLIFDLGLNENDVISFGQDTGELIIAIINWAEQSGRTGDLALAVERILTPVPVARLPRLEKLEPESPPTVLRHFLLAHYDTTGLMQLATDLGVDWELIDGSGKRDKVRNLLLYLYRRNRLGALIAAMKQPLGQDEEA